MKEIAYEIIIEKLNPWTRKTVENLPTDRRRTVLGFLQCLDDNGLSASTLNRYLIALKTLDGTPYEQLTADDIRDWVRRISQHHKPGTTQLYANSIRRFLKWIHVGNLDGDEYPACVSWLKTKRERRNLGRDILSTGEVKRLIDVITTQRDRALFFVLYESGTRAGEITGLKVGDVEFDRYGAVVRVGREHGKTGERRIRLFESVPDLQLWLSMHPKKDNPAAPLWPSGKFKGNSFGRRALTNLVKKYATKAGIKKKISPHTFRHSRATHLATVLKEAQMREFFGWSKDSDMPSVYVHLSGRDVDETLFEHYGIKPREDGGKDDPLKKKVCPRCKMENSASARFCWRCWASFDTAKADDLTAKALEILMGMVDPAQFRAKLKEKGLDKEVMELAREE